MRFSDQSVKPSLAPSPLQTTTDTMFTGIVAGTRQVVQTVQVGERLDLWADLGSLSQGLQAGASVAIDGVCLTAVEQQGEHVLFHVIRETLERSTLGDLVPEDWINVERSYRVGDEIGGHDVSGHVIGTGAITEVRTGSGQTSMCISIPREWMKYVLTKGFIAVDGASLTVGETDERGTFWLHLIPETLKRTTLGRKTEGSRVNVELDARTVAVVDTVERVLAARGAVA